jgi:hypothetical protein
MRQRRYTREQIRRGNATSHPDRRATPSASLPKSGKIYQKMAFFTQPRPLSAIHVIFGQGPSYRKLRFGLVKADD